MSIATFRKFQMKKAETLSKKTLFSKFLRVPFLQNTPPPPPPAPSPPRQKKKKKPSLTYLRLISFSEAFVSIVVLIIYM